MTMSEYRLLRLQTAATILSGAIAGTIQHDGVIRNVDAISEFALTHADKLLQRCGMMAEARTEDKAAPVPAKGQAVYTVTIWRDLGDDTEVIGHSPDWRPTDSQLIQQLRKELQEGWDAAGIAGHFDISAIVRRD